jgi:hypothetical protein
MSNQILINKIQTLVDKLIGSLLFIPKEEHEETIKSIQALVNLKNKLKEDN